MRKLIEFIRSVYVVVLFVLLEAAAIGYYARSTDYAQARLLARSSEAALGARSAFASVRRYFSLASENRVLLDRIGRLEERLSEYEEAVNAAHLDSCMQQVGASKYRLMTATVVANSINRNRNMMTINRGRRDGVTEEMAVLAPDGSMAGYVVACSERYSVAMSVLNTSFRASGKLEGSDFFGSIRWDGLDQHVVILDELSKYADPQPGQEVLSTGFSQYFPADILIGWVESAELNETRTAYTARVRLAAELSRLTDVILVENRDLYEIRDLEASERVNQHNR